MTESIYGNKAFLFDLDGVIIDTESQYTRFWSRIDELFPTGVENFAQIIKGTTLTNIFNQYFPDPDVRKEITLLLDKQERDMIYEIKPGVINLLESLREHKIPAVMVTSSNDIKMAQLWRQHPDFHGYFSYIVTADMVTRSKPDPQGYLIGASKAGVSPENCIVFEDSLQGVMAGREAGAFVVGVSGTIPVDKLKAYSDMIVDTLEDIDPESLIIQWKRR